jgi:hypothetical protein
VHLFLHCPLLNVERQALWDQLKNPSFFSLLTKDADVATTWAIRHFDLDHFKLVKENLDRADAKTTK